MEMIGKVRRMHRRDKKSVREIARATGLSRNTVAKWLQAPVQERPKYRRTSPPTKLTPFHEAIRQALKADTRRPKRERRTARALHEELKAAGYGGGYSRLTDFIRAWREGEGQALKTTAFVPLAFELGEAYQFDWSEEGLVIAGVYRRVQLAHMKLCASRAFWLVAYPGQGHEMMFDAHARGFAALGIARRGIYDNMKTAVDQVRKGKGRVVNSRFAVMCAHYLVDAEFCNVASGWEKGIVEKNVQDSRRRVWHEATRRRWGSFEELNAWLGTRCRELWQELRHPEHEAFSIAEMLEHERTQLPADDRTVRRLRREARARVEHVPGIGGAQPLLRAMRAGRPDGLDEAVSEPGEDRRRRRYRRRSRAAERRGPHTVRLAALRAAAAAQARRAAQRRPIRRPARAAAAVAPGAAARGRR
jgi:transposase